MDISLIAAIGLNHELGYQNHLIWHIPQDLQLFKKLTLGHHVLMGRKTHESIGFVLPERVNMILSRNKALQLTDCVVVDSPSSALRFVQKAQASELIVIGGAEVYRAFLPYANRMYLSRVQEQARADCFFPTFDLREWQIKEERSFSLSEQEGRLIPAWQFQVLERLSQVERAKRRSSL